MSDIILTRQRLIDELKYLATFTEHAQSAPATTGGIHDTPVTRIVFTPRDVEARAWLDQLATQAGLIIRRDAVGRAGHARRRHRLAH
jgi:ureidoglycolate amidohydrolase